MARTAPGVVPALPWATVTAEQIPDAWTGLTAASTGLVGRLRPARLPVLGSGSESINPQLPAAAGIGGTGSFVPTPNAAGYAGLTAGSTGFAG